MPGNAGQYGKTLKHLRNITEIVQIKKDIKNTKKFNNKYNVL